MADVQGMLKDPQFSALPPADQRAALGRLDPSFSTLSDSDYATFRQRITAPQEEAPAHPGPVKAPLPYGLSHASDPKQMEGAGNGPGLPRIVTDGIEQLGRSIPSFAGDVRRGASDMIEGLGKTLSPLAIPAAITAPAATLGAGIFGAGGSRIASSISSGMGGDPETSRLIGNVAAIPSAALGGATGQGAKEVSEAMLAARANPKLQKALIDLIPFGYGGKINTIRDAMHPAPAPVQTAPIPPVPGPSAYAPSRQPAPQTAPIPATPGPSRFAPSVQPEAPVRTAPIPATPDPSQFAPSRQPAPAPMGNTAPVPPIRAGRVFEQAPKPPTPGLTPPPAQVAPVGEDLTPLLQQSIEAARANPRKAPNSPVASPQNGALNAKLKADAATANAGFADAGGTQKALKIGKVLKEGLDSGAITRAHINEMGPEEYRLVAKGAGINEPSPATIQKVKDLMSMGQN